MLNAAVMGTDAHSQAQARAIEQAIFAEALEKDSSEAREAYLTEACGDRKELRRSVEELLMAAESAGAFLENPPTVFVAGSALGEDASAVHAERAGDQMGRYRLLEPIGEGGCGVVYKAEQLEPVHRYVALKVIKMGMDTRAVVARFEAERQALALMDHPNIARVFDGGATQSGRPYFVMEWVQGTRITEFCDHYNLSVTQRLQLFVSVCYAIHHAHQKGVIHRDIKPSNILVAMNDGVAVAKVIDFGIAKAIAQRLTDKTLLTQLHAFVGTPAYMSPEQAEGSGMDIDTRSDIYSLGVLLFELLTGQTPFDSEKWLRSGVDEWRRIIREQEPPRASVVLRSEASSESTPKIRHHWKHAVFPEDLDWIVMKCLEKDRSRRFESAASLAGDIERFLAHEPIQARPPTLGYRTGKWVRKHKRSAIAASLIGITLCVGSVTSTVLYLREQKALESERVHRTTAEIASVKSTEIARFLEEMLSSISPDQARGRDVSVLMEMLEHASSRVETEFKSLPEVEASVRWTIGHVYRLLGQYDKAEPHLVRSRSLRETVLGVDHVETLRSWLEIVELYSEQGRLAESEALCRRGLEGATRTLGANDSLTLEWEQRLALICLDQRKFEEAEQRLKACLASLESVRGPQHLDTLKARGDLAAVFLQERKYSDAEAILSDLVVALLKVLPPEHPAVLREKANLAATLHGLKRLTEAEALYRETWETESRVHGTEHPKTLVAMQNLGSLLSSAGRHAEAEKILRQLVTICQRTLGAEHPRSVRALDALGLALGRQRKFAECEALAREALAINQRVLGPEHSRTLRSLVNLADAFARRGGQFNEAERLYREALSAQNRTLGPTHGDSLLTAGNLLMVLKQTKNWSSAETLCRETYDRCRTVLGAVHPTTQEWSQHLDGVLKSLSAVIPNTP